MKVIASLLLILAIAGGAFAAYAIYTPFGPPAGTSDQQATYVDIAPGTGTRTIATQLQRAGVIHSRYAFLLLRAIKGGKLQAGEYRFNHPAPATEVYNRILRGDVYTVSLTIPEGYNIFDIAQAVDDAGLIPSDQFLAAERSQTALIHDLWPSAPSLEGFLFPDTYRFPHHTTSEKILAAMVSRFRAAVAELGIQQPAAAGQTIPDKATTDSMSNIARIVTLASLVEKEVSQDSERPLVAGVFVNRLAQGMPLATDPSVIYAALLENRYRGTIYASDLKSDSPYNTYVHPGLPPGPICNPGMAALRAAISPAHTDYLYFVADAQGHSQFSTTLKQHSQQVQSYRRALQGAH